MATLGELVAIARKEADDAAEPYLWPTSDWYEFANDAENEACRRARLITDASTTAICTAAVAIGAPSVTLDPRVIFVRRAQLALQSRPLTPVDSRDLDQNAPNWEAQTGTPRAWVRNWETGKLRLWPTPQVIDTLRLRVVRLPLVPMEDGESIPEINPRLHRSLVFWMLYRAYSKQDSQTYDEKKAALNLALFEREFGQKSSAIDEAWIQDNHTEDEGVY